MVKKSLNIIIVFFILIMFFGTNIVFGDNLTAYSDTIEKNEENNLEYDNNDNQQNNDTSTYDIQKNNIQEEAIQVMSTEKTNSISNTSTIEPGIYEIYTAVYGTRVIDVHGASTANGTNVEIYDRNNGDNQKFKIVLNNDGSYTFFALHSNKVLDVCNGGKTSGTNVWQYTSNGTDAQKWYFQSTGDGFFNIVSKLNNLYLNVNNGIGNNGQNIEVSSKDSSKSQKFELIKVQTSNGKKTIENGIYKIYSKVANNRLIEVPNSSTDNGVVLKTAANNNSANQKFQIIYNNDGTYSIFAMHSRKVLDVKEGGGYNSTPVWQYASNGTDAQKWIILENNDKTYSFISKRNGLALDIYGASSNVGASVQTYKFNSTNAQKFTLDKTNETEKGTQSAEDGTYRILSLLDCKKVFDIESASMQNGGIAQVWDNSKVIQQKFDITYVGDGYYKIKAKHSNKVLTVENSNPRDGSKITQSDDNNLDTQKWILKKQGENRYSIISKCGNLYIDLGKDSVQNGQDLQLKYGTNANSQIFIFVNETPKENIVQVQDGIYQLELNTNKVIDVCASSYGNVANIQIYGNDKVQQQKFHITRVGNTNYYNIVAVHSGKSLDVEGGNTNFGANVIQYSSNAQTNQQWLFKDVGNGYYNIISRDSGLCLDIANGKTNSNGANVQLYYMNDTQAQKFKLKPINIINNNTYEIETKLNGNMILDVAYESKENKANIQLYTANDVNHQKFILEALTTDTYKITAKHSNKALTVDMQTSNVYQSDYIGESNQQWQIKEAGEGYYTLICKANGKALDVYDGKATNEQNIWTYSPNGTNAQKFRFVTGQRNYFEEGTYGKSGLVAKGDPNGTSLKYYKFGKGSKKLFAGFSIHGFEDSYNNDGAELTYIAEEFKNYLKNNLDSSIINNWTIYIFPCLNPDGQKYGWTNNGPGRNTLYSMAPGNQGIDMNRNWSVGYKRETSTRNYNGTAAFQAYEARDLRDFILNHQGSKNIVLDIHGWLNETIGDYGLGAYYRNQFGLPNHIYSYGSGYFVNWARTLSNTRSVLVELPQVWGHDQTVNWNYPQKFINATMQMLREN